MATLIEQKSEIQFEIACFDNFVSFYRISIGVATLIETVTKFKKITIGVATLIEQRSELQLGTACFDNFVAFTIFRLGWRP